MKLIRNIYLLSLVVLPVACSTQTTSQLEQTSPTEETSNPRFRTPNNGIWSHSAMQAMVVEGIGEHVKVDDPTRRQFRSTVIQQYQSDESDKRNNAILFGVGTYHYWSPFQAEFILERYQLDFIWLDGTGKMAMLEAHQLVYEKKKQGSDWVWVKSIKKRNLDEFYKTLPAWAKRKLWQISGSLATDSGESIVDYDKTDSDLFFDLIEMVQIPGTVSVVDFLVEHLVGKGIDKMRAYFNSGAIRFGHAFDIEHDVTIRYADKYIESGKATWDSAF